jgi:tRNA 2-thiocytidine biosynthesis protein TtcA
MSFVPLARPPWTGLGKKMENMCRKALYEFQLLEKAESLAIALSGGKDSLALLFLLKAILGHGFAKLPLHAIHVSGEFSCGASVQERYLSKICEALEVEFSVCVSQQKREKLECYSCSRERRRLIFEKAKSLGITTIAFGHHRDDSIQTLLMNLLHKAEFAGNLPKVPMEDYGVMIIRPLIYISEVDIRKFASHYGFARVMCGCPVGQRSLRKKADELIQDMEKIFPNARTNLAQASLEYGSKKAINP